MCNPNFKVIEVPDSDIDSFDKESFCHLGLFKMPLSFGNPLFDISNLGTKLKTTEINNLNITKSNLL